MIKRYEIIAEDSWEEENWVEREHLYGDWVRYEDCMEEIAGLRETIKKTLTEHARTVRQIGADPEALSEYMDRMAELENTLKTTYDLYVGANERVDELEAALQQEKDIRGYERMLNWRDIYPDDGDIVCKNCGGSGNRAYGGTSTWRGGAGGQQITVDICDKCWGSGVSNRKGVDLRRFDPKRIRELEELLMEKHDKDKVTI